MTKNIGVAIAVIYRDIKSKPARHEILLQKKDFGYRPARGKWVLFGGHLEHKGETPAFRLREEMKQELGEDFASEIKPPTLWKTLRYGRSPVYIYLVKFPFGGKKPLKKILLGEGAGYAFLTIEEIQREYRNMINKGDLKVLNAYIDELLTQR